VVIVFFFQAEDGIRDGHVTGVQTCALPISSFVCRHRGGPLAMKDGNADMLICKYHGWTYRLDGMLRGVPHFNRVELFDKRDYGRSEERRVGKECRSRWSPY